MAPDSPVAVFDCHGRLARKPTPRRSAEALVAAKKARWIARNAIQLNKELETEAIASCPQDYWHIKSLCGPIVPFKCTAELKKALNEFDRAAASRRETLQSLMTPEGAIEHLHQQERAVKRRRHMAAKALRRKEAPSPVVQFRMSKAALRRWRRKWWAKINERAPSAPRRSETAAALREAGIRPTNEAVLQARLAMYAQRIRPAKLPRLAPI